MQSTLKPKQADDPHDFVVVASDAVGVAPADEELSSLLQEAARRSAKPPTGTESELPAGSAVPPVDTTFRPTAVNDDVPVPGKRGSVVRRTLRAFLALVLAACIGVVAFAWRSYGDTAEKKIVQWTTKLILTASLQPDKPEAAAPAVPADAASAAPPQPAPPAQSTAVAPAAGASADSAQLLQSMARDLASVGQEVEQLKASIEELKASQQQTSRDIAKTSEAKTSEARTSEARTSEARTSEARTSETRTSETKPSGQNLRPRISAAPSRPAAMPARKPPISSFPPPQAAAAAPPPQTAAPYVQRQTDYVPRPPDPQAQSTVQQPADPELASVPRPPMPVMRQ